MNEIIRSLLWNFNEFLVDPNFGELADQLGHFTINFVLILWLTKWVVSIFIELGRKGGGKL